MLGQKYATYMVDIYHVCCWVCTHSLTKVYHVVYHLVLVYKDRLCNFCHNGRL